MGKILNFGTRKIYFEAKFYHFGRNRTTAVLTRKSDSWDTSYVLFSKQSFYIWSQRLKSRKITNFCFTYVEYCGYFVGSFYFSFGFILTISVKYLTWSRKINSTAEFTNAFLPFLIYRKSESKLLFRKHKSWFWVRLLHPS